MTEPKPPIDALDEQERELARVLRALPGGEPPAALDQKILRAAANAAASSRRPRTRWLASVGSIWGIGGAAAAVLALGITWQMLDPTRPANSPRSQPVPASVSEDSAVTVDLGDSVEAPALQSPAAPAPAASPPMAPVRATAATAATAERKATREASPVQVLPEAAFAAAPPPPETVGEASGAAPAPAALATVAADSAEASHDSVREQAAMLSAAQDRARSEQSSADLAGATAAQAKTAASAANKAMTPAVWLAKVRQLRSEGRTGEARNSLELFHRYYPQYVIPADLAPLLRE